MANSAQLKPLILEAQQPVFAVLDGAQFEDLPRALFDADFVFKSLYLDRGEGDRARILTAPQLVWLDRDYYSFEKDNTGRPRSTSAQIVDRLIDLVGGRPAVVFWMCGEGGDVLYRHLRTINMILLPATSQIDRGKSYERNPLSQEIDHDQPSGDERVLFRHADSNVMAQVMPSLSYSNMSRVLGPANQILYSADADWSEKPMSIRRAKDMSLPKAGPLKLNSDEVVRIENWRRRATRRRRVSYLQDTCPVETKGATQEALERHLLVSEETGAKLGLISEGAHCRWAFMMCKTNGRIAQSRDATEFISRKGVSPDEQVKVFMRGVIGALRSRHDTGAV
ncbi:MULTISPECIES: hypothetical protein [unclassified Rhizobium]|uniref:hypothetical protein n=1 Tax=unclassified Rhizobium TaxID=2613769 RepID=UPI000BE7E827|nr:MULTISPECIES: hypothetical protein [unclassified Rhizobium]PDT11112.1 hypothetical protein CO655_10985 [Rhizobium sp. M1]PDT34779.1 hypothetical protein CO671_18905 [Rhizobium sp. M10]